MTKRKQTPVGPVAPTIEDVDVWELPVFDPSRHYLFSSWGRKHAGKSTFNRRLFRSYPFDKIAIDVNGDADPGPAEVIKTPLPAKFPPPSGAGLPGAPRPRHRSLYWRADPGSATYYDDLDRAVGMALFPQDNPTMVWCGEVAEFMPSAMKTAPNMRRLLNQNRHYKASALFDGPRPVHVNPLVLAQSDVIAIYHMPNPDDRERVAKTMGYPADRFNLECAKTWRRGPYWYLLWVSEEQALYRCPPLPED